MFGRHIDQVVFRNKENGNLPYWCLEQSEVYDATRTWASVHCHCVFSHADYLPCCLNIPLAHTKHCGMCGRGPGGALQEQAGHVAADVTRAEVILRQMKSSQPFFLAHSRA